MVAEQLKGGHIFDIQGFSVHDGPGCRTLIFLKGCPMRCSWCSNPEGIHDFPEPLYDSSKCTMDLLCMNACPGKAISVPEQSLMIDRDLCRTCSSFACVESCFTGAIRKAGYFISTSDLMKKIQRDRQYWGSNGGITLTGGEPFLQPVFTQELLKQCFSSYIHTSVETCGNVRWENIRSSLDWLEWVFFDLKHMDPEKHKKATGVGNKQILKNAQQLSQQFKGRLIFRIPFVKGFNDDEESLSAFADFILANGKKEVNLLPLHHLGRDKYRLLHEEYYTEDFSVPSHADLLKAQQYLAKRGVECYAGSDTPF
jgi:pyruvate formate lyase activating enzyme